MGYILSNLPDVRSQLVNSDGILTDSSRLFLNTLQRIIDLDIAIFYRVPRFNSLALLTAGLKNPPSDALAVVTGQGLAIFKTGVGWVKTSDDTTAIT